MANGLGGFPVDRRKETRCLYSTRFTIPDREFLLPRELSDHAPLGVYLITLNVTRPTEPKLSLSLPHFAPPSLTFETSVRTDQRLLHPSASRSKCAVI
jgi:hypothetical protein